METDELKAKITNSESTLTLKWGVILVCILGFFGWLVLASLSHENRITRVETKIEILFPQIADSLKNLQEVTKEIRDDQKHRQDKAQ